MTILFIIGYLSITLSEFPHSDICGLSDICSSPQLFAACHVLHRLPVPRHPPCALLHLTKSVAWCAFIRSFIRLFVLKLLVNFLLFLWFSRFNIEIVFWSLRTHKILKKHSLWFISISFSLLTCLYTKYIFSFQGTSFTLSGWWRIRGSNPWPPACKAGALPAELIPHKIHSAETWVSLERRWSSRSFSNGYLVTTSPQSLVLP